VRKVLFILSELSDPDIDWILENSAKQILDRGTVLIQKGKPVDALYILLDGNLSISLTASDDEQSSILRSGEILGELSFLDRRPPSATVTAVDAATVLAIPRESLILKLEEDMGFAARFYRALGIFLATRLRRREEQMRYGNSKILDDGVEHEDELDSELLNQLGLAGARFDWILERLRSEGGSRLP
jgi:bacteriocin-type transport-associated protein